VDKIEENRIRTGKNIDSDGGRVLGKVVLGDTKFLGFTRKEWIMYEKRIIEIRVGKWKWAPCPNVFGKRKREIFSISKNKSGKVKVKSKSHAQMFLASWLL